MRIVKLRSNPISPDPRVEKEAKSLSKAGFEVYALGWDRTGILPRSEKRGDFSISRLQIQAKFGSGLMNFPALFRWQIGLMGWLLRNKKNYEIIHACDFDTILPALVMKIFWKKVVIYDIFDFYADHLRKTPKIIKNLIRQLDFWAINHSDGVILVDDSRRAQISGSKPKICVSVYNSPDDLRFSLPHNQQRGSNSSLRISYIGLLQVERGLFELIEVLKNHPNWFLDLAGFGGDEDVILSSIKDMKNVHWHGRIPYQKALELSHESDVLIATYDPSIPNHRYSSPNKVFEAMMLGKPIIVAKNTNMDLIIEKANCGIIVKYGVIEDLEKALTLLDENKNLRFKLGENARQAYEDTYSWAKMQERLLDLYDQVLSDRK
ncbi:MAG: glycosyltransferase WbuB [Chloroflexi bacterium HGW-Chloroflexi-3]|nr:MAG: glycosyltransferase WbuB [Chloroflexi bacterium HGW-Chloroflexi-3]